MLRRFLASLAVAAFLLLPGRALLAATPAVPLSASAPAAAADQKPAGTTVQATVSEIEKDWTVDGKHQMKLTAAGDDGKTYRIDTSQGYTDSLRYDLKVGTRIVLEIDDNGDGTQRVFIADVVRTGAILWMFLVFALITVAVGYWRGFAALVGFGVTLGLLFGFVFPHILSGGNPVLYTMIGGILILAINMHLSHGFSRSTTVAFLGTVAGLFIALIASAVFIKTVALTGLASDEANFLYWRIGNTLYPPGVLLAAILLGAVGVLDDVTVTQAETVEELLKANPAMPRRELFASAMRLGRHHIASTVNTLVLAYVGASMPLFLLSMSTPGMTIQQFLNTEQVAEEAVRTLAGTLALILAVPISTWLATMTAKPGKGGHDHGHVHSQT